MLRGTSVLLVSTADQICGEGIGSLEQYRTQARMLELGAELILAHKLKSFDGTSVELECRYSGRRTTRECAGLVPVTARTPDDSLFLSLMEHEAEFTAAGIHSVRRIGDCQAPGLIVAAVFAGHRYARELGANDVQVARDRVVIGSLPAGI